MSKTRYMWTLKCTNKLDSNCHKLFKTRSQKSNVIYYKHVRYYSISLCVCEFGNLYIDTSGNVLYVYTNYGIF